MANLIFKAVADTTAPTTMAQYRRAQSKFTAGRTFAITGAVAKQMVENEGDIPSPEDKQHFIFTTDIDEQTNIWLSQYNRDSSKHIDRNNQIVLPDGTFDALVFKALDEASDDETVLSVMQKVVTALNGRKIRVRRKNYIPFGGYRSRSLPCFDIVD